MSENLEITGQYISAVKKEWFEKHKLLTLDGVCKVVGCSREAVEKHIRSGHLPVSGRYLTNNRPRLFAVADVAAVFGLLESVFVPENEHKEWILKHSFLSRSALAELLCCHVRTVERIMADGDIVYYRRGKMSNSPLMFRLSDIEDYLKLIKNTNDREEIL